jgi:methyltransferase (TIGR00027 family)
MRDGTPSRTAQFVAAARGLAMLLPDDVRIAEDPYGVAFASPQLAKLISDRDHSSPARALVAVPGLRAWIAYMQVRTRLLDDAVREFVAANGRQIVLLGAGYDCRALRMPELADSRVYEVDHPATQAHKRDVLDRIGALSPSIYVTWDFETRPMDELPEGLAEAGHDARMPTLTIWEGVTMYLTEGAIDASLRAIAAWSGPGSRLAMTYFAKSQFEKPSWATRVVQAAVSRLGEPWKFGWRPEQLPEYLEDRGFCLERDVSTPDAARELLPAELARTVQRADSHVAFARIATPA